MDWLEFHKKQLAWAAVVMTLVISAADWIIGDNISLGALYPFAMITASLAMPRSGLIILAVTCAVLREAFGPFQWQPAFEIRLAIVSVAYWGVGTLVAELNRNRRLAIENLRQREQFRTAQRESEQQLSSLLETSPLPILIANADGTILLFNEAGEQVLGLAAAAPASNLFHYLPDLKSFAASLAGNTDRVRLEIECSGRTSSGDHFLAHVWLSKYQTSQGARLAVVLWDASEDLRGREIATVDSVMSTSRVLLAAFAHEVKNLTFAATSLCSRLSLRYSVEHDPEYAAVTKTFESLSDLALSALRLRPTHINNAEDLSAAMEQIRIVVQPLLESAGVRAIWQVPERLPRVRADHTALIQVFLNLARNTTQATHGIPHPEFKVEAMADSTGVLVTVWDNGTGVADPENLFQPFRSAAGGTGLGLYVSRSTLRSCGGDLRYEPGSGGACFKICLQLAATE